MSTAEKVISALQAYKPKKEGANNYRCNSPLRSGSDSHSFVVKIEDDEHGSYFDHVAEEGGSLYDLAKALGIDTPTGQAQSTKRAYESVGDYAKAHGIPEKALTDASWQYQEYQNRPALKFPTKKGYRFRFLDGNKPNYKSVQGYKRCWYGLNQTLLGRLAYGSPLIICNGEISTVSGQFYGLAAACVTSGEKDIPKELVNELKAFTEPIQDLSIIIALDCDEKGRKTALAIKKTLSEAGFNSVRAVDLQLSNKGDLADYCMLHGKLDGDENGILDGQTLLKCPDVKAPFEPEPVKRWELMHASKLDNMPPVEWLVYREIPKKGLTVLFGPSGTGKSFMTLDYALKLAQESVVIYIAAEGESGYPERIKAWKTHHKKGVGNLYMVMGAVSFMDTGDMSNFIQSIETIPQKPVLIIIDTLARSMLGADENSTRDMSKFVDACDQVRKYFDCSLMLVHHTNKGGVAERGSGVLRGSADSMIKLIDEDDLIRVEAEKTKDGREFTPRFVKLLPVNIGVTDSEGNPVEPPVIVDAEKVIQSDTDDLTIIQLKVLQVFALSIYEYGASASEIESNLPEVNQRTLFKVLSRLKTLKFIEQSARREPYKLTNSGREKIGVRTAPTGDTAHTNDKSNSTSGSVSTVGSKGKQDSTNSNEQQNMGLDVAEKETYYSGGL